jgi:hypothetical protein
MGFTFVSRKHHKFLSPAPTVISTRMHADGKITSSFIIQIRVIETRVEYLSDQRSDRLLIPFPKISRTVLHPCWCMSRWRWICGAHYQDGGNASPAQRILLAVSIERVACNTEIIPGNRSMSGAEAGLILHSVACYNA